jgi:hypothetical protein
MCGEIPIAGYTGNVLTSSQFAHAVSIVGTVFSDNLLTLWFEKI